MLAVSGVTASAHVPPRRHAITGGAAAALVGDTCDGILGLSVRARARGVDNL